MSSPSDKHMEAAADLAEKIGHLFERRMFDAIFPATEIIARALAEAEREGMRRAAEIARAAGKIHIDFAALGLPIEPSKIIAEDRARVASKIADRILSETGEA